MNESFIALRHFVAGRYEEMEDVETNRIGLGHTKEPVKTTSTNLRAVVMEVDLYLLVLMQGSLTST